MIETLGPQNVKKPSSFEDAFAINDGGRYVSAIVNHKFVRVWDVLTGATLQANVTPTDRVVVSGRGKYVATAVAKNGKVGLWRLRPLDLAAEACEHVTRNLTEEEWRKYLRGGEPRKTCASVQ